MLVPPYESSGKVIPVTGTRLVIAIIFTTTCASIQENTPATKIRSLGPVVPSATLSIRSNITPKTAMARNSPTNPNVSPMIANTESLMDSGK